MKTTKFEKRIARLILAIGNRVYLANKERIDLQFHYTHIYCGHLGKKEAFYFQFDKEDRVPGYLKYFRFSPGDKPWAKKLFDVSIGASGMNEFDRTEGGRYITLPTGCLKKHIEPEYAWIRIRLVPFILFRRWVWEQLRSRIKLVRNIDYLFRMKREFGSFKYAWRISRCKHPNMHEDGFANGDTGQEWFECPDCGFSQHIVWY